MKKLFILTGLIILSIIQIKAQTKPILVYKADYVYDTNFIKENATYIANMLESLKEGTLVNYDGKLQFKQHGSFVSKGTEIDSVILHGNTDTINMTALNDIVKFNILYTVKLSGVTTEDVSIALQEKIYSDSVYVTIKDHFYPYTLNPDITTQYITSHTIEKYCRWIVDWGTNTNGTITIIRKYEN